MSVSHEKVLNGHIFHGQLYNGCGVLSLILMHVRFAYFWSMYVPYHDRQTFSEVEPNTGNLLLKHVIALYLRCTHVTLTTRHRNLTLTVSSHFHTRPTHTSHWPHHVRHRNLTLTLSSHFHTRPTEISILHHILEDSAEIAVPITVACLHCIGSRHKPKCRLFHLFGVTWNSTWITYR